MKHKAYTRKLGRDTAHRLSMMRNMARSLFEHRRIMTTHIRALELKKYAERLINIAKKVKGTEEAKLQDLSAKRAIFSEIGCNDVSCQLFDWARSQYADTNGGYTRITKYRFRKGDCAHMVLLELV